MVSVGISTCFLLLHSIVAHAEQHIHEWECHLLNLARAENHSFVKVYVNNDHIFIIFGNKQHEHVREQSELNVVGGV